MNTTTSVKEPTSNKLAAQLIPIGKRLPAYIKLAWLLALEPSIPVIHRAWLYATVVYIVSPAHFVMNVVPVFGQVDWILLLMFSMRQALKNCPPKVMVRLYKRVNLDPSQLQMDIDTLSRLCHDGAESACTSLNRRVPAARRVGRQLVFAGRVANGFSRRVAHRVLNQPI